MVGYSDTIDMTETRACLKPEKTDSPHSPIVRAGCTWTGLHSLLDRDGDGVLRADGRVMRATSRECQHAALGGLVELRFGEQHVRARE